MARPTINLDGGETSIIKALGIGGGEITGEDLLGRLNGMEVGEVLDVLQGLIAIGYVSAERDRFHSSEEMKKLRFRVNSGYAKELKEALDPRPEPPKSRRVRRE